MAPHLALVALDRLIRVLPTPSFTAMDKLTITAMWDPEANVWVAESEDIGIATEAPSLDALVAKLPAMIQDLRDSPELVPFDVTIRVGVRVLPASSVERRSGRLA